MKRFYVSRRDTLLVYYVALSDPNRLNDNKKE